MDKIIKRKVVENPLWEVTGRAYHKKQAWHTLKTVCIVCGLPGSGKTTYIYEYFKSKNTFYFSFAGLTENLAEKLFADYVSEMTSDTVCGWEDSITAISKKYKFILFDDVSCVLSSEKFCKAFYKRMITNIYSRPFVVFITEPTNKIKGLADRYDGITVDYFSIPEMIKLYPTISKYDILRLCAVSGGIPKIFNEYDTEKSFQDNLKNMLKPSSAFVNFMPDLLIKYFRKPENYHHILCAIANGNHSVSEIGKFIGFAYNKCDTYLNMLITYGLVKNDVAVSKRGTKKTAYRLANSYFRFWYLYVYMNRSEIQIDNQDLIDNIIKNKIDREVHVLHLQKAFAYANEKIHWELWESFRIKENAVYSPQMVNKNNFNYTFDAIVRNDEKAIFIKVFDDPLENCKYDELKKIRKAIMLTNTYYDSHIFIFSKRRFTDYAVSEAANDGAISLVELERLKY